MSIVSSVGTAVPPFMIGQGQAREFCRAFFHNSFSDIDRLLPVFENSRIENRYFAAPLEWFGETHTFEEKNRLYIDSALEIGEAAIQDCLQGANLEPQEVDHIFFVSSTGLATPSVDARLINRLKFRQDIRRTPIWGLGCAGGAAGLSRAFEYTQAFPQKRALVLALELCGLTFQPNDRSKSNLVATALFADGAAAALISGRATNSDGPRILASRSNLWYDSLDVMGWTINNHGFQVMFSSDIPSIVRKSVLPSVREFVGENGIGVRDLEHIVAHPGGTKVIEAYEQALDLKNGQMSLSRDVLSRYGNMSSPTVLFVLGEFLQSGKIRPSEYGLVTALGPGFSSEMLLLRG